MARRIPGRAVDSTTGLAINNVSVGSNLTVNTSAIFLGNSTVNTVVTSSAVTTTGVVNVGSVGVNTSTIAVGSNLTINTTTLFIGNSTVNTTVVAGNINLQGTQLTVGNVTITGTQITVGNSTVNSVLSSTGTINAGNTTVNGFINVTTNTATFGTAAYIVANGNVGVGTAVPAYKLDVSGQISSSANLSVIQNVNGGSVISLQNSNTGTTAYAQIGLGDSSNINRGGVALIGSGFTQSGQYRQTETYVYNNGTSGITIHAETAGSSVKIAAGGTTAITANTTAVVLAANTLTMGTAAYVVANGNIGIGYLTPNARLSFGTSIIDNKLYLYDGTSDKYGFGIRSDSFLVYSGAAGASTGGILLGKFDGTTFTENMRVRNDGIVVKPKQPCFATYGTNGNYALSGVTTVPFDATPDINVGSHYNSATSIFTAPVAGYYFVSFSVLIYPNTIDTGEYITVWASKNDGSYGASGSIPMARQSNQENQTTMGSQGIVYLAANDNLRIKVEPSGTGLTLYLLNGHAHFAAYLLG